MLLEALLSMWRLPGGDVCINESQEPFLACFSDTVTALRNEEVADVWCKEDVWELQEYNFLTLLKL